VSATCACSSRLRTIPCAQQTLQALLCALFGPCSALCTDRSSCNGRLKVSQRCRCLWSGAVSCPMLALNTARVVMLVACTLEESVCLATGHSYCAACTGHGWLVSCACTFACSPAEATQPAVGLGVFLYWCVAAIMVVAMIQAAHQAMQGPVTDWFTVILQGGAASRTACRCGCWWKPYSCGCAA
jgi:hypothetical protein